MRTLTRAAVGDTCVYQTHPGAPLHGTVATVSVNDGVKRWTYCDEHVPAAQRMVEVRRETNALTLPLYARKPQRKIPGVEAVAVTLHKSADGTVHEVALFSTDGTVSLGTVHHQHRRTMTRSRGWSLHRSPLLSQHNDQWPTLAEAATALAGRHGVTL